MLENATPLFEPEDLKGHIIQFNPKDRKAFEEAQPHINWKNVPQSQGWAYLIEPDIILDPCPFCGQNVRYRRCYNEYEIEHPGAVDSCIFLDSESYETLEALQTMWNKRV